VNEIAPVIFMDNDPVVRAHAQALLADSQKTMFVTADIREPDQILDDPTVRDFIDSGQPVGLLLAILHYINDDEDPTGIAARLRDALPPGRCLAVSSLRMPGPEHPEDAAKSRSDGEAVQREAGDRAVAHHPGDPHLVRRLGTHRARPGTAAGMAARPAAERRAGRKRPHS